MDLQDLSTQQVDLTLRLSDLLSIEDLSVAAAVLASFDWNIQKALNQMNNEQKNPPKPQQIQHQPQNEEPEQLQNFNYYQQDQAQYYQEGGLAEYDNKLIDQKLKMFQEQYSTLIPLQKTISQPSRQINNLQYHKNLAIDSRAHREQYLSALMIKSDLICKNILQSNKENKRKFYENKRKIQNNRKFINYLYTTYHPKINFTFGTFFLNLTRSYLQDKYLLVYIHSYNPKIQEKFKKIIELIFKQKEIARFVNNYCISYGMYDSSDDYQVTQKYIPLKQLPAFALFRLNKTKREEEFISSYTLSAQGPIFMQWLASSMGITLKKKEVSGTHIDKQKELKQQVQNSEKLQKKQEQLLQKKRQEEKQYLAHAYIRNQQDELWFEMEQLQQFKKQASLQKKTKLQQLEQAFQLRRQQFSKAIQPQDGDNVIEIRFRMPITGESKSRRFLFSDKIQKLFQYVDCCHRDEFEQKFNDFDLKQSFPPLNLSEYKNKTIEQVFQGSKRQNIIVRQI